MIGRFELRHETSRMTPAPQILLPLEGRRPDRFEDFVPGPNGKVVVGLQELVQSEGGCVFLRGAEGSGKTHLLNAAVNHAQGLGLGAFYMPLGQLPDTAAAGLAGLETMDLVCLDDVDRVAGQPVWERDLFDFFNRFRAEGGKLVVSSSRHLLAVQFKLPDLASRLAWGLRLQIETPDDEGKAAVLRSRSAALGIELPPDVANYLLSRGSRNISVLLDNLQAIHLAALQGKRRITIPLAREVLTHG
jgi:DnaA-homolog protein